MRKSFRGHHSEDIISAKCHFEQPETLDAVCERLQKGIERFVNGRNSYDSVMKFEKERKQLRTGTEVLQAKKSDEAPSQSYRRCPLQASSQTISCVTPEAAGEDPPPNKFWVTTSAISHCRVSCEDQVPN